MPHARTASPIIYIPIRMLHLLHFMSQGKLKRNWDFSLSFGHTLNDGGHELVRPACTARELRNVTDNST